MQPSVYMVAILAFVVCEIHAGQVVQTHLFNHFYLAAGRGKRWRNQLIITAFANIY